MLLPIAGSVAPGWVEGGPRWGGEKKVVVRCFVFSCLVLALWAITQPGGMCVFSAANELAVAAFLAGEIRFTDIDRVIDSVLQTVSLREPDTLAAVQLLDANAREAAGKQILMMTSPKSIF